MKATRRPIPPDRAPRDPYLYIHTDEQWEALASDVRLEMVEFMATLGPCSIADLARAMDTAADGLYHHLRRLLAAGVVRRTGDRRAGRRREALFDVASNRFRFDVDVPSGRNADRLRAIVASHLRRAARSFERSLRAGDVRLEEPLADTTFTSASAWLDDDSRQKVRRHLEAANQIMASHRRDRLGRLYSLAYVMCPVRRRRGAARIGNAAP